MKYSISLSVLLLLSVSCSNLRKSVDYTSFGEADPAMESRIVDKFVSSVEGEKNVSRIKVLSNTLPDGVRRKGKEIAMEPGAKGKLLGKFSFKFSEGSRASKVKAIRQAKHLAQAAGGDTAVIFYEKDYNDIKSLHGASGYIFNLKAQSADSSNTKSL